MVVPEWPTQAWYAQLQGFDTLGLGSIETLAEKGQAGLGVIHLGGSSKENGRQYKCWQLRSTCN